MEFRSLIQKIFGNSGNEPDAPNSVRMELINDWKNVFFSSGLHTNDILVKTCIDVIAKHAAKLKPTHIVLDDGKKVPAEDSALSHLLIFTRNHMFNFPLSLQPRVVRYSSPQLLADLHRVAVQKS